MPIVFFSWLAGSLLAVEIHELNNPPGRRLSVTPKSMLSCKNERSFSVCKILLIAYLATYISTTGLSVLCWRWILAYAWILAPMLILSLV